MRKLILTMAILFCFLLPNVAGAQSEINFDSATINIWPEYDQPAVLIVYGLVLASNTQLPADLTIHIPSGAQINAVAVLDSNNSLVNAPYTSTVSGDWTSLKITTDSLQLQIEFYSPLDKNGPARHIDFKWYGDYAVNHFDVNFLRPFGAENVQLSTSPTEVSPGQDNLTNYRVQELNLEAGSPFSLAIDYTRNTDDLSISSLPVQAASTPGPGTPGRVSMTGVLPWMLGALGVLLIGAGILGFVVWQRGGKEPTKRGRHRTVSGNIDVNDDNAVYCHQCGKRAQSGDVFCRTCGTRLRKE
jgi:hypothetical protein